MRLSADWMTIADERILEFLSEEGPHSPSKIAEDERIRFSAEYVGRRCRKLADYGLTRNIGNGVYSITNEGEQYLIGELDTTDLTDTG
ncbi:winged helix-turn-helix domain-containing protein [Halobacteriales archaeon QS_1_68_20]|nr:MAG: winged helix-turn-helix domain-containing protein [Halobacteriales archaeon QS_1_68_20]